MNDTEKGINGILKYVTMPIRKRIPDFLNNITAHVMHDFLWLCIQRRPFFVSGGGGVLIRYQLPEYFSYSVYLIHKTLFIKSLWNENNRIKIFWVVIKQLSTNTFLFEKLLLWFISQGKFIYPCQFFYASPCRNNWNPCCEF